MSIHALRSSFNAGEISPLMDARVDAEKYSFSCRRLENFIPKIYGGAFARPGMMYLGSVGDASEKVMLIPFNVSATSRYILELGDAYLRIWNSEGELELDKLNFPYTNIKSLTTPYAADDLFGIKFVQLNNACFFVHPDYPPQKFQRSFSASFNSFEWTFAEIDWSFPCFRSINQTDVTATPSATTGTITLSFSENIFTDTTNYSNYAGAKIQVIQRRASSFVELPLAAVSASSSAIKVLGGFQMSTYGVWDGTLTIQRKDSAGAWEDVRTFNSDSDRSIVFDSFQPSTAELRLNYTSDGAGSSSPRAILELEDSRSVGVVEIVSVGFSASLPVVNCTVIDDLDSTAATTDWALEAWGVYSGYPRAVTFHEQRLWFGGTELEPNTFWASAVDDFFNFYRGAYDADSLSFTLAAHEGSSIQSMLSHESLLIFTQTEEWSATTSEQTAITPNNIFVRRQSRTGSAYTQAFIALNNILFLQRGSRKVREFNYLQRGEGASSEDLSQLAEHITVSGIKQLAYQQQPDPIIWSVTNDGVLLSLTYERGQNVIAWAKHPTEGTVESVAVIYGDANSSDEVWMVVKRGTKRNVERLDPDAATKLDNNELTKLVYLDSSKVVEQTTPTKRFTGFYHLEGETVSALVDGEVVTGLVVTEGVINVEANASTLVAGLPYEPLLQPSKIEVSLDNGTTQGRTWMCKTVNFNLWKTRGLKYADNPASTDWFDYPFTDANPTLGEAPSLYTGLIKVNNLGSHRENVDVTIKQTLPLPCNVLAMIPKFDVMGE